MKITQRQKVKFQLQREERLIGGWTRRTAETSQRVLMGGGPTAVSHKIIICVINRAVSVNALIYAINLAALTH